MIILHKKVENKIIELAERIVIDYANLSGRENANRAEFRERTIKNITDFYLTFSIKDLSSKKILDKNG